MDNLLIKTLEFSFVPEVSLSAMFLIVFVGIFAFGVYRQHSCKELLKAFEAAADENFKAVAMKMSPELFIKKNLRKISTSEDILEELPNVFVSIGIVATFLGLGVAIQGASELLQTDKLELPKLTAVLGVIAFKFQTSVWGICFSIVFRNIIVERYFEFRRQLVDEVTDRLYLSERENTRTLIERQNELLAAQHKEILDANIALNYTLRQSQQLIRQLIEQQNKLLVDQHKETLNANVALNQALLAQLRQSSQMERENFRQLIEQQNKLLVDQHKETLNANVALNQALLKRLSALETALHADNLIANEHLGYLVKHFKEFFEAVADFAENELAFAESVDAFRQRVKIFQEEFAALVHEELADLKAVNENLGRIHAEHIQQIHDEHASNIFYTTQELDKLHQKFYLEVERFAEETRHTLENLLETTIGHVHDEYTHEAHEICAVINDLNVVLETIDKNVAAANREFIAEQKQFIDSWHTVANKITETMDSLINADTKANNRLETLQRLLGDVARNMQSNYTEHLAAMTEQSQSVAEKMQTVAERMASINTEHLAAMTTQSQSMVDVVKNLQEKISELTSDNQTAANVLLDELVAVKNVLENLSAVVSAEIDELNQAAARLPDTTRKHLPINFEFDNVDGR